MICEITNRLTNVLLWTMGYGDEKKKVTPDTEVSIGDFISVTILTILMLVFITWWWWIPVVWIYNNSVWGNINNSLSKKRFKCKGTIK